MYNIFNHTQLYSVDGDISDGGSLIYNGSTPIGSTGTFGQALKARDPRQFQFALKFLF